MRNLISSLKNHNEQLKGEIQRYKRKLREAQVDINKASSFVYLALWFVLLPRSHQTFSYDSSMMTVAWSLSCMRIDFKNNFIICYSEFQRNDLQRNKIFRFDQLLLENFVN